MLSVQLKVEQRRFLPGCAGGLAETTALVDVAVLGAATVSDGDAARFRDAARALYASDDAYFIDESDWPGAFLLDPHRDGRPDSPPGSPEWLGCWVIALTVAIQRWGRDPVWRGRVVQAAPDRLRLAIPWRRGPFFDEALALALRLIEQWLGRQAGDPPPSGIADTFGNRWQILKSGGLAPYTLRFIRAARQRGLPFEVMPNHVRLGWGARAERIDMSFTGSTHWMAVALAKQKSKAGRTLAAAGIPVPPSEIVGTVEQAEAVAARLGWPVVVKPTSMDLGMGVTAGIAGIPALRRAFANAAQHGREVLVEKHIDGDDHRLLVVHDRMLMAGRRIPASVVGDGVRSLAALIDLVNADPRRGSDQFSLLTKLKVDDDMRAYLADQGLQPESVPQPGVVVRLSSTANIGSGATALDVTQLVHPDNRAMVIRAVRVIGLDVAGVDFLTTDISRSWREVGGAICEVNSQPGLRVHRVADPARDIEGEMLDILRARTGRPGRIPTAAVTGGADGEGAAVAALVHRIWTAAGALAGVCTTRGVRVGADDIAAGDHSGLPGMRMVLGDPGVQAAVFEVPAASVAESGHGCDRYDVVGVLGGGEERGDDPVAGRAAVAVVDRAGDPGRVTVRMRAGGLRAVLRETREDREWIVLATGDGRTPLLEVERIDPDIDPGVAMFAAAMAWAHGIEPATVARALTGATVTG